MLLLAAVMCVCAPAVCLPLATGLTACLLRCRRLLLLAAAVYVLCLLQAMLLARPFVMVDTGACYGGDLSAYCPETGEVVTVPGLRPEPALPLQSLRAPSLSPR
jgi:hypothetical protein